MRGWLCAVTVLGVLSGCGGAFAPAHKHDPLLGMRTEPAILSVPMEEPVAGSPAEAVATLKVSGYVSEEAHRWVFHSYSVEAFDRYGQPLPAFAQAAVSLPLPATVVSAPVGAEGTSQSLSLSIALRPLREQLKRMMPEPALTLHLTLRGEDEGHNEVQVPIDLPVYRADATPQP